jgi:hypothetical protein
MCMTHPHPHHPRGPPSNHWEKNELAPKKTQIVIKPVIKRTTTSWELCNRLTTQPRFISTRFIEKANERTNVLLPWRDVCPNKVVEDFPTKRNEMKWNEMKRRVRLKQRLSRQGLKIATTTLQRVSLVKPKTNCNWK